MVEIAFGRLKARWRRLSKQIDMDIDHVPHVISAYCVLHVCEVHKEYYFDNESLQEVGTQMAQPNCGLTTSSTSVTGGEEVWEILIDYFKHNNIN